MSGPVPVRFGPVGDPAGNNALERVQDARRAALDAVAVFPALEARLDDREERSPARSSKVTVTVVSMLRPSSTMNMVDWKTIRRGRSTSVKTFLSR
jgi:type IV secretory pathway TrbF-like protein